MWPSHCAGMSQLRPPGGGPRRSLCPSPAHKGPAGSPTSSRTLCLWSGRRQPRLHAVALAAQWRGVALGILGALGLCTALHRAFADRGHGRPWIRTIARYWTLPLSCFDLAGNLARNGPPYRCLHSLSGWLRRAPAAGLNLGAMLSIGRELCVLHSASGISSCIVGSHTLRVFLWVIGPGDLPRRLPRGSHCLLYTRNTHPILADTAGVLLGVSSMRRGFCTPLHLPSEPMPYIGGVRLAGECGC